MLFIRYPIPSPKNTAAAPNKGPIIIPASTDERIVKENCTVANLISKVFVTIQRAASTAMYAIFFAADFSASISEKKNLFQEEACFFSSV